MKESLHINPEIVARRCAVKSLDYRQLTPLDWIVLDFADGLKSFSELSRLIPAEPEDIATAYYHLRLLGLITWQSSNNTSRTGAEQNRPETSRSGMSAGVGQSSLNRSSVNPGIATQNPSRSGSNQSLVGVPQQSVTAGVSPSGISQLPNAGAMRDSSLRMRSVISLTPAVSGYSDEVCAQYLPPRLFTTFRRFQPTLLNASLDIPTEAQVFIEFIHENLSSMSPCDLLGLPEGTTDKALIRQAYLNRTKQFHPDRYFRKNTGAFAPRIAAIFKAISSAFATLQAQ